ncbi:MAG: CPBP family glutamic-type intramembrane protease [Bacilli bacterium]|nr:CPBP family glutamic-type intramembrane protease [Bacilli bacterium]
MKNFFHNKTCPNCGLEHDPILSSCPNCGRKADLEEVASFENHVKIPWLKQLLCFLIGWAGFQLLGIFVQTIESFIYASMNSQLPPEELSDATSKFLTSPVGMCIVNSVAYVLLFGILAIVNFKDLKEFGRPFANWKTCAFGALGFVLLYISSFVIGVVTKAINPSMDVNQNQKTLVEIVTQYPAVGFIVFGIFGPVCEEITYRVGLFSLLSRSKKILAYILTVVIFAFIHFGWTGIIKDPSTIGNELLNLPSYLVAGLILSFIYDRFGFGASALAHITYNVLACAMMFAA